MKNSHEESLKRLQHIVNAINSIENYIKNESEVSFCENEILNNAVLFQFTVIGEAIVHVESEKLNKYDYPWYKARAFRNMIVHEYFNIKLTAVWRIIKQDMPQLKLVVEKMLKDEFLQ